MGIFITIILTFLGSLKLVEIFPTMRWLDFNAFIIIGFSFFFVYELLYFLAKLFLFSNRETNITHENFSKALNRKNIYMWFISLLLGSYLAHEIYCNNLNLSDIFHWDKYKNISLLDLLVVILAILLFILLFNKLIKKS